MLISKLQSTHQLKKDEKARKEVSEEGSAMLIPRQTAPDLSSLRH